MHKQDYNRWLNGKHRGTSLYPYIQEHGLDNFYIKELQRYEVVDRQQQLKYEQEWIDRVECVNKFAAFGNRCIHDLLRWNCITNTDKRARSVEAA